MDTMAEAHAKDSRAERQFVAVARDIDDLLRADHRISAPLRSALELARIELNEAAAHIVAVWD